MTESVHSSSDIPLAKADRRSFRMPSLLKAGLRKFGRPENFLAGGLILACAFIALAAASAYQNSQEAIENERSAERSLELLSTLESLFLVVKDLNTQAVAYERNPDPAVLEKYGRAKKALAAHLRNVKTLSDNKARRSRHLSYLQWLIVSLEKRCDEMIERAKSGMPPLKDASTSDQVQLVRDRVVFIELDERRLVRQKVIESERDSKEAVARFATLGVLLSVLFILLVFVSLRHIRIVRASAEAEKKIRSSITENAPLGVLIVARDYSILSANATFASYLGLEAKVLPGKSLFELVPELTTRSESQIELEKSDPAMKSTQGSTLVHINDEERLWNTSQWTMADESGKQGYILLIQDVTEQARLARQKELLVETIAHDLKTPLIASRYTLESVMKMESDSQKSTLLLEIDESVDDVLNMVRNLLELSCYEEGAEVLSFREIDVNTAIQDALAGVERLARSYEIDLSHERQEAPLMVKGDLQAVVHMFANLLSNAIKFSPVGGTVKVSAGSEDGNALIEISDSGPGMSESERERLFNRFSTGSTAGRTIGSTGLGLYLSQEIVRAHQGRIDCRTKEGKGTTFVVTLPLA